MKILVIDVGGTNIKAEATSEEQVKFPSGPEMSAKMMVDGVLQATGGWQFDAISIGYPGPIVHGHIAQEPRNLGPGWVGYDFDGHFGKPVKLINDAAMQALGSYEGGRMLFLGLGTGLGSALIVDKVIAPLELAHLPFRKGKTYEDYLGVRALKRLGRKKWNQYVCEVSSMLKAALVADYVVLGGGNAKKLKEIPSSARLGDNRHAILGGIRLWKDYP